MQKLQMSQLIERLSKLTKESRIAEEIAFKILVAEKVKVEDYSEYCPYRSCNGGQYLFLTKYRRNKDGNFAVVYETTAEFDFCPIFGQFQDCWNCPDYDQAEGICTLDQECISPLELLEMLVNDLESNRQTRWVVDGLVFVDCEGHQPGWCSLCQEETQPGCYLCL